MFYKEKFAIILSKIKESYNSQEEFSKYSGVGRTYISQYMNMKLDSPPKPEILKKIAESSKGITNYDELMEICGYITYIETKGVKNSLTNPSSNDFYVVPILFANNGNLYKTDEDVMLPNNIDKTRQYFGYRTSDDSMLPLLGTGDIAIVEKTNTFKNGQTCLLCIDNKNIMIRKIIDFQNYIELQTAFPYSQPMKLTTDEMKERNFTILGRIIKVENQSAFK